MSTLALISLITAITGELAGTMSLCMASSTGRKRWWVGVVVGYVIAFSMLSVTLAQGVPLGVAYGIWSATGVTITAVLNRIFFKEPLTWVMSIGIILLVGGVLLIEIGGVH